MHAFPGRGPLPERVDVTIIGGGVTGVALARECAQAHKSVLLVERHDFASGTTSRSNRLVHGGLHYLEQGEFGMLRESLSGRAALLREQPHLVQPIDFVLAVGPRSRYSTLGIRAALWLYRKLGKFPSTASDADMEALHRMLNPAQRWSLYGSQDAQCEFPERLVADWLRDACAAGAVARNRSSAIAIPTSEGRVRGVIVRDAITSKESYVESEWVINATGPWVDMVRDLTGLPSRKPLAHGVRKSYVMLRPFPGAPNVALHATHRNGPPISITPWNGMLQIGATEISDGKDPSLVSPGMREIEFLVSSVAAMFPKANLTMADVVFSYAGVHPMLQRPTGSGREFVNCRHVLHNHADQGAMGLLSVFGGTLATASSQAQKTVRTMGLHTAKLPKPQSDECSAVESTLQQWAEAVNASTGIPRESTEAIARWHGRRALCVVQTALHDLKMRTPILDGHPQLVAQAAEAVEYEHAVTLADILLRRVPMALSADWNEDATLQAAGRIALAVGWSESRMRNEVEAFENERAQFLAKPKTTKPSILAA